MKPDEWFFLCSAIVLPVVFVFGWFFFVMGKRSERNRKNKTPRMEMYLASGVHNLLEEGREEEAVEVCQKFAGVDEYTARNMVEKIKREVDAK